MTTTTTPECQHCGQAVVWARPRGFGEFVHVVTGQAECPPQIPAD